MTGFKCTRCGKDHSELPLNYRFAAPVYYDEIPENEQADRTRLSEEQCVIDDEHFFIAGNVEIPIRGSDKMFSYTVWVSLSEKSFERATALCARRAVRRSHLTLAGSARGCPDIRTPSTSRQWSTHNLSECVRPSNLSLPIIPSLWNSVRESCGNGFRKSLNPCFIRCHKTSWPDGSP